MMPILAQGPQKNHAFGVLQVFLHVICKVPGHRGRGQGTEAVSICPAPPCHSESGSPSRTRATHSARNRLLWVYSLSCRLARWK